MGEISDDKRNDGTAKVFVRREVVETVGSDAIEISLEDAQKEKSDAVLTEERIDKLDEIGMRWEKNDPKHLSEQAVQTEIVAAKAG